VGVDQTIRQALAVAATPPQQRTEVPLPRWTLKRLVRWVKETFAKENTVEVLKRLRVEFPDVPIKLVWDGAPYHRAQLVQQAAQTLDIGLVQLPAYSPDFMPVEHLWHWLREDVTYHTCYDQEADLIAQVDRFQAQINADPIALADRLSVKSHLDPKEEKLRVST
jgi:transposase